MSIWPGSRLPSTSPLLYVICQRMRPERLRRHISRTLEEVLVERESTGTWREGFEGITIGIDIPAKDPHELAETHPLDSVHLKLSSDSNAGYFADSKITQSVSLRKLLPSDSDYCQPGWDWDDQTCRFISQRVDYLMPGKD
ncbi:hypothetical protein I302_104624 [Kwoniella bestiolae CBS 10118]|uniref:Uncharacterized protein n=1 Tax=Kwoniella bestiolae CBS 10118 TaxID=1296100 RepID=A0A1B9GBS4_9TREE|nr:hypothetical protein I302_03332 [Kwoniella bestiolae CBS 10118]OCF28473.1 hypothetical protein I302_03332 [Kwoniella bestiolae CBS 10118]